MKTTMTAAHRLRLCLRKLDDLQEDIRAVMAQVAETEGYVYEDVRTVNKKLQNAGHWLRLAIERAQQEKV